MNAQHSNHCRIVVTDDDPSLLTFVVTTLRDAGHCVFAAYDGDSACELALAIPELDLLVTNTRLGTVSARDTHPSGQRAEAGSSDPAHRRSAAQSRWLTQRRAQPAGAVHADELLAAVRSLLARREARA